MITSLVTKTKVKDYFSLKNIMGFLYDLTFYFLLCLYNTLTTLYVERLQF